MTALFTAKQRIETLTNLATFFRADEQIASVVLVGSSAEINPDKYSGLDLLVVVKNGAVFASVYRKWKERLVGLLPVCYHFEQAASLDYATYSLLLHDYLEINLFFWRVRNLTATQKVWQILFDQTETQEIEGILQATYTEEAIITPIRTYRRIMGTIWQPLVKCVAALNRGETWRALHMLEQLRNQTIELAAMTYGVDTRNYAEVDKLPEMLLVQLRHSLPASSDNIAIRRALRTTISLFFKQAEQLEKQLGVELAAEVQKKLVPYVEAYAS